jgi:hypothetical protein
MSTGLLVINLPKVIYQEIKKFLVVEISSYELERLKDDESFDGYNWEENQRSWRLFLSISSFTYFCSCIRKGLYSFALNRFYSFNYFKHPDFRPRVLLTMTSPYQQLTLNLSNCELKELASNHV